MRKRDRIVLTAAFAAALAGIGLFAYAAGEDLRYVDGRSLPLEGKGFANTPTHYERLPSTVTTNVNALARKVARQSAGLQFRFRTDSDVLDFRWTMRPDFERQDVRGGDNMTGILAAGIDVYRQEPDGTWRYVATGRPSKGDEHALRLPWTPGDACLVYLPCYGAVSDFRLGLRPNAKVEPVGHANRAKPVVFYGTSITQGGSASRPGLAWVSQVGRELDVPVVNLGFSGSGRMELEMADHLAAIDASCYVLDCVANLYARDVEKRVEPFVRRLRAAKPDVPIVLAERTLIDAEAVERNAVLKTAHDRLVASGMKGLHYVPAKRLMTGDGEDTVEGGHPNDVGMKTIAGAFARAVRSALSRPADAFRRQCPDGPLAPGDLGMEFPDVVLCRSEPVDLPDLLKTFDGKKITTKEEWEKVRRPEILRFFTEEMFGVRPVERPADLAFGELSPDKVMLGGKALRKRRIVSFSGPRGKFRFSFTAFIPTGKKPVASFINICCPGRNDSIDPDVTLPNGYWPVREIVARGYAAIAFQPEELAWDEYHPRYVDGAFHPIDPDFTNDVYACFAERRTERSWGMISVWAWGASRILDWIETEPLLDAKRVAVVGHSRCGKTALWCGATDPRVALVCANNSGCCGAKLNHVALPYAEPIGMCTLCNPQWFCRAFNEKYTGQDAVTPYDQHWLVALVAPRLVCIASGSLDYGAGPWGEYLGGREASPAWELYGKKGLVEDGTYVIERPYQEGSVGYHLRKGPHGMTSYDWARYMDFADRHLR